MNLQPKDVESIAGAIVKHGITPSAQQTLMAETFAAEESQVTGLYVSWMPHPDVNLGPSAADEIKNRTGQCCRVSSKSICMCGHPLSGHDRVVGSKTGAYVRPPKCTQCKKCTGYNYAPVLPEECGQWWLSRRKDFNVVEWRKVSCPSRHTWLTGTDTDINNFNLQRVRTNPHEYACIGCEASVADHETVFESRAGRLLRGAAVDADYVPLSSASIGAEPAAAGESDMDVIRERAFAPQDYSSNANVRIRPTPPRILPSQTKK